MQVNAHGCLRDFHPEGGGGGLLLGAGDFHAKYLENYLTTIQVLGRGVGGGRLQWAFARHFTTLR